MFDEPLYAHYLSKTEARHYHPGADEVIATMENDGDKVVSDLILGNHDKPVLFFKHMTHHLVHLDWRFLDKTVNVILTRDPVEMLPSYVKQVEEPTLRDLGYPQHVELLAYLRERGQHPPILDSKQTLLNPEKVLTKLCANIGIPFDEAMLSWQAGARPEDGCWAKYWYHAVHQSTAFQPYRAKTTPFPERLKPLLDEARPYYEQLASEAISG